MSSSFAVELPATIRPLLEAEARDHGFASAADYLAALIRANAPIETEDASLEDQLAAGLAGGEPTPADSAFWMSIRARVHGTRDHDSVD